MAKDVVRNFWVEVEIDGRKTILRGGPAAKNGGFKATFYQRSNGGKKVASIVTGSVSPCGNTLALAASVGTNQLKTWTPR